MCAPVDCHNSESTDYDDVFEHIIETDTIVVPPEHADSESHKKCIEWPNMREAIKYKLNEVSTLSTRTNYLC